jgi:hypothetical protein
VLIFMKGKLMKGGVHSRGRSALLILSLIPLNLWTVGCALIHTATVTPLPTPAPSSPKQEGILHRITHPLSGFHLFSHKSPPPKAVALRRMGTIRTLSQDGSYVIVELEPGVLVAPGNELLVTGTGSEPARLKVGDVQPPYFAADIVSGNPKPGDPVKQ